MSAEVPAWLSSAVKGAHANYAKLTIATLADQRTFGRGGFALSEITFQRQALSES